MARTCKKGIDYFSHDTSMSNDFKVKMIQAKHGIVAYAIYNKLLEKLYDENGYWLHLSDDVNILFCNDNIITIDVYILVLNECINYKLFNADLYKKYNILTSERIQKNYCEAVKRRKQVDFIKEYLLLKLDDVYIKDLNVNILTLNADIGTQKKGKDTKREESKPKPNPKGFLTEHKIDWIKQEVWIEWIDYKKKRKLGLTDRALKANVNKLHKFGRQRSNELITFAIDRGWKDIYDPDDNKFANTNKPAYQTQQERTQGAFSKRLVETGGEELKEVKKTPEEQKEIDEMRDKFKKKTRIIL